ncbi:MAG TPA: hypothetical protein VEK08_12620 [Planctomycetota bacterium]|nr:hypothetical protein [Planctomycetota bacterium]
MLRTITLYTALVLLTAALQAEESLNPLIRAKIEKASKALEAAQAKAAAETDEKKKRQITSYVFSLQDELKSLQARLELADKSDAAFRDEIPPLQKTAEEADAMLTIETDVNLKKQLTDKAAAARRRIEEIYTELNFRVQDRLEKKFGRVLLKESFENVVQAVSRESNTRIVVDQTVSPHRPPVSLKATDMSLGEVLSAAADSANAAYDIERGEIVLLSQDELWKRQTRKKLQRKVTFEFVDTPVDEAIAFLRSLSDVTMILDPRALANGAPAINLRVTDMSLELALQWILRLVELDFALHNEALFIAAKGNLPGAGHNLKDLVSAELAQAIPDAVWKAEMMKPLSRNVSFEFVDTPLAEALAFLNSLTKLNIILDPKVAAEGTDKAAISLRVQDMKMYQALYWICTLAGLEMQLRSQAIFITHAENARPAQKQPDPPQPAVQKTSAGKIKLRLPNGAELETDGESLKEVTAIEQALLEQLNDSTGDGVLFYTFPGARPDLSLESVKAAIALVAPKAAVSYDEKLKLLMIKQDDARTLRQVAALMRELKVAQRYRSSKE